MANRISRREFHRLAAIGAAVAPLAGVAEAQPPDTSSKSGENREQEAKLKEVEERRNKTLEPLRSHTLAYGLEPAFTFHPRVPVRRVPSPALKAAKG
jgi:hypothetical protein